MAVDAMEATITHPEIAVFILVSGDGDYSSLVQRLRGVRQARRRCRRRGEREPAAGVGVFGVQVPGTIVTAVGPATRSAATAAFDIADAEEIHLRAFGQIAADTVTASAVKSKMLALDPSFDQARPRWPRQRPTLPRGG